jgi:pimeloyl-ACP methyl ester carboxylesterase
MTQEILLIHGMYMNARSWQPWVSMGNDRGFACTALSWPFHEGEPAHLRSKIDPALGRLTFGQIVGFYKKYIESLAARPMLIGHSIGGLVVQKLVNDGYAHSAVVISSAPPQGILSLDPTFYRANFPHINPFAGNRPIEMTRKRFHFTFGNTMSRADSDIAFTNFVVPESRNVPRSTLTTQAKIDFKKPHVPLLMISGDTDHLIPLTLAKRNFAAYKLVAGDIEFREFSGRSHFICNEPGWEEVANVAFNWLRSN